MHFPNLTFSFLFLSSAATLFYIGSNVIDWPLQAQRGLADGHEMYVHGDGFLLPRGPFPALRGDRGMVADVPVNLDPTTLQLRAHLVASLHDLAHERAGLCRAVLLEEGDQGCHGRYGAVLAPALR